MCIVSSTRVDTDDNGYDTKYEFIQFFIEIEKM